MASECFNEDELILIPYDRSNLWKKKLKPVIATMKIWGFYMNGNLCQSVWSKLIFIYMHIYIIYMIIFTSKLIYFKESFWIAISNIIYLIIASIVLLSHYKMNLFVHRLNHSFSNISNHNFLEFADYRVSLRDKFRMMMFWLFCISCTFYIVWDFLKGGLNNYYEFKLFGLDPNIFPKVIAYGIAIFIELSFALTFKAGEKLMCFYFSSICRFVSFEFTSLKCSVSQISSSWNRDPGRQKLLLSMDRYMDLCDVVGLIDLVMSPLLFLLSMSLALQIIYDGNYICKAVNFCSDPCYCIQYFVDFLMIIIAFIDVFMSSSSITMEAQEMSPVIYKIASSQECHGKDHLRSRIGLWYWKIITDPPKISGFGTFGINRSCLLNILGVVITFVVIMYELA
ncbi:uncharacterized protein LOC111620464 [Centruroides sculpturatus]|uniref:uncharacterized protein LOC111620464 n=1 Tax=Centruroides sculpturatus TaxID=218467 RepID=UPI000C6D7B83|nr:uncharacterized protein LOC111620464 [Centruroides sculpturatus]